MGFSRDNIIISNRPGGVANAHKYFGLINNNEGLKDRVWRGLTVGPDDTVVLFGKIDKDFPGLAAEIKVYSIEKP
jgi:hypothetical protein